MANFNSGTTLFDSPTTLFDEGDVIAPAFATYSPPQVGYLIQVRDRNMNILDEVPAKNLQYSYVLNDAGSLSMTVALEHPKCTPALLAPGKRVITVMRDGVRIWGGPLWTADTSSDQEDVRFGVEGFFSYLRRRYIDVNRYWEDTDQLQIAWNIINTIQGKTNGDLGITRFDPGEASGANRTRRYKDYERVNVAQALQDLAEINNGFDFEITPTKQWKTFYPQKGNDTNMTFELGKNIDNVYLIYNSADIVSEVSAMGAGDRRRRCIAAIQKTSTITDYGLLEQAVDYSNVKHYDILFQKGKEFLKRHQYPRIQPQINILSATTTDPPFGTYNVGDRVQVRAKKGYIDIDRQMRIISITVQVADAGYETVQMHFDEVQEPNEA